MRRTRTLLVSAAVALVAATAGSGARAETRDPAVAATATEVATPRVTKLLVIVEENHSLAQMRDGMPYTFSLAKKYSYATDYHALMHPSLPNYLAIAGGSTFGVTDDRGPSSHPLSNYSVFGQARHAGKTARVYAESQPTTCALSSSGRYAVRHNPWTYWPDEGASCRLHDRGLSVFTSDTQAGRLPRVGMLVPNLDHDAHDGSLAAADAWFKARMTTIGASPDWKSGRLAVVLTADEDDSHNGNVVLTTVLHPSLQYRHLQVTRRLDHYSLTRLYGEVAGLPPLRNAKTAPSMAAAFGLPVA